ncbi:MAG TPA: 4-alpha-glucanotransferase [Chloroflexota bacterium]|nr:4-alpha-glucanotransferase [Chloroflexota bacterium]
MTLSEHDSGLLALADLYGIDTTYQDIWGGERRTPNEAIVKVLQSLGAPLATLADVPLAHAHRLRTLWSRRLEPVTVAWDGRTAPIAIRVPAALEQSQCACVMTLEDGSQQSWQISLDQLQTTESVLVDRTNYVSKTLSRLEHLPLGYHRFSIELGGHRDDSLVISAPSQAWTFASNHHQSRHWGVFMPLYALRTRSTSWGGNLSDLERLASWTGKLGGSLVGTLPLLASFLDEPFEPSPYSPASRLFWNELFLDPLRLPELGTSLPARENLSAAGQSESRVDGEHVDYEAWSQSQRSILEDLSATFFNGDGALDPGFQAYLSSEPRALDYARFRAVQERQRSGWVTWPEGPREGGIGPGDFELVRQHYHLYAQWRLQQQLGSLAERSRQSGARLYLDFPLGVHPDSYDTWRERDSYATRIAVGAPPDMFFTGGQNWGFPPLQPDAIRTNGYSYLIDAVRNHMRFAGALRIDHVMGLKRLFWIPTDTSPQDGAYVRYAGDELFAILALESRRSECLVVGEDLGTVPDSLRSAMTQHDFLRMYVAQFEMTPTAERTLPSPAPASMASVNTHDTALFGGFWNGLDIEIMQLLNLISDDEAGERRDERARLNHALCDFLRRSQQLEGEDSACSALRGMLRYLAAGPAQVLMVTLEDLWLECAPQNVPGTGNEWQNWRRKARYSFEEFSSDPDVLDALGEVHRVRQTGSITL